MTLATFLQPGWLLILLVWNFAVLSAAQLTIRLIMAYSIRTTSVAAVLLSAAAIPVSAGYDLALGGDSSLSGRLAWAFLPMVLTGLSGFAIARWVLRIRRLRGQLITALMVGLLDPHLFALLLS